MAEVTIRECTSIEELDQCVLLQRDVFGLPDLEISPRRHLIVSRQAGGWTLGVIVSSYGENFYGTDYPKPIQHDAPVPGIDSDRLFAGWHIRSARVERLGKGESVPITATPEARIKIPSDWTQLLKQDPHRAKQELLRTRDEFQKHFDKGLVCAGFERGDGGTGEPQYLFYRSDVME